MRFKTCFHYILFISFCSPFLSRRRRKTKGGNLSFASLTRVSRPSIIARVSKDKETLVCYQSTSPVVVSSAPQIVTALSSQRQQAVKTVRAVSKLPCDTTKLSQPAMLGVQKLIPNGQNLASATKQRLCGESVVKVEKAPVPAETTDAKVVNGLKCRPRGKSLSQLPTSNANKIQADSKPRSESLDSLPTVAKRARMSTTFCKGDPVPVIEDEPGDISENLISNKEVADSKLGDELATNGVTDMDAISSDSFQYSVSMSDWASLDEIGVSSLDLKNPLSDLFPTL